jgi:hypothetical protein
LKLRRASEGKIKNSISVLVSSLIVTEINSLEHARFTKVIRLCVKASVFAQLRRDLPSSDLRHGKQDGVTRAAYDRQKDECKKRSNLDKMLRARAR